jgi:hypothetical protein
MEVVDGCIARHMKETSALATEEELDRLQAANSEPAMQGEWRKLPYQIRSYEKLTTHIPARALGEEEGRSVLLALRTNLHGISKREANEVRQLQMKKMKKKRGRRKRNHNEINITPSWLPTGNIVDEALKVGKDLRVSDVWGLDCHTRKSIVTAIHTYVKSGNKTVRSNTPPLADQDGDVQMSNGSSLNTSSSSSSSADLSFVPLKVTPPVKCTINHFIDHVLLPAINCQTSELAHDMRVALQSILHSCKKNTDNNACISNASSATSAADFSTTKNSESSSINNIETDKFDESKTTLSVSSMANVVLDSIFRWGDHNFRIHPKGKGVIVDVESGIPNDRFVNEYLGEVYPSWLWSSRQNVMDRIEQVCRGGPEKEALVLPDFWNMQLERHAEDDRGRLLFTIDPSHSANFSSRLSHSCTPNCQTSCVAINDDSVKGGQRYTVVLHSVRQIKCGEELTIDYNAVTPSRSEFQLATCLCGSSGCRGSFLYLNSVDTLNSIIKDRHTFNQRMAMLVQACRPKQSTIDNAVKMYTLSIEQDENILLNEKKREKELVKKFLKENGPKRPCSSFFLFSNDKREEIRAEMEREQENNEGYDGRASGVAKRLGEIWNNELTLKERAVYERRGKKERELYEIKLKKYQQNQLKLYENELNECRNMMREDLNEQRLRRYERSTEWFVGSKDNVADETNVNDSARSSSNINSSSTSSSSVSTQKLNIRDARLQRHGFAPLSPNGLTLSDLPLWTKIYAARVLGYVEYEKMELEQRLYDIATQDIHNSAATRLNYKNYKLDDPRIAEGWSIDEDSHPLMHLRLARQFPAATVYGHIVASLSPKESGEKEWYFVHLMDDGDIEELEVFEIEAGIALLEKLEEEKKAKAKSESVIRLDCSEQAAGVADQRVSNLCVTLDRIRQMLKESTLMPAGCGAATSMVSHIAPPLYVYDEESIVSLLWNNDQSLSRKTWLRISKLYNYDRKLFHEYILQEEKYEEWKEIEDDIRRKNKHGKDKWMKAVQRENAKRANGVDIGSVSSSVGGGGNNNSSSSSNSDSSSSSINSINNNKQPILGMGAPAVPEVAAPTPMLPFLSTVPPFVPIASVQAPSREIPLPSKLCDIDEIRALIKMDDLVQTWAWSSNQGRQALLALSSELRKLKSFDEMMDDLGEGEDDMMLSESDIQKKDHAASCAHMVSDVLTLYAHTETIFVPHRYGIPRNIRYHDVAVVDVPGTNRLHLKNVPVATKEEGCGYIRATEQGVLLSSESPNAISSKGYAVHSEILNWNVQSKEDYIQTVTTERATGKKIEKMGDVGVAYLPSIESCFRGKSCKYTLQSRRTMMEHLRETPLRGWEKNNELKKLFCHNESDGNNNLVAKGEENDIIIYGSPMFDDVLATIDSPGRSATEIGPSTQRVLEALRLATVANQDNDATDKVMEGLTVVKEQVPENWIQCEHETCMKWRKIPIDVDVSKLPEPWYCSMNQWDPSKSSCNAVEDSYDDDQEYKYVKEEKTTVQIGEKIDLFCQLKGGWSEAAVKDTRINQDTGSLEALCHYLVRFV